jgi:hypothetical protein
MMGVKRTKWDGLHEHCAHDPVIESCGQRCILEERNSRLKASFGKEPDGTQVEVDATSQWE